MKLRKIQMRQHLASRPWTDRERFVVWRGMTGRAAIAIEPLLGTLFFGFLTWGVIWRARVSKPHDLWILSPLFGLMALGFALYFIAVMVAPLIAYMQTYKPIYVLDGYVRYRGPDTDSDLGSSGYVAVLFEDRELCCEWECYGTKKLPSLTLAAMTEFSEYGGIHKIDGKSTGVLPDTDLPLLAIGIAGNHGLYE
jgi:hypothetical protein